MSPSSGAVHARVGGTHIARAARRAVDALKGLEKTLIYLRAELEAELEGQAPPTFLVDWDVIQMFAEFRLVGSIYATSVMKGFEKAAQQKMRLVVPQGTRMEFVNYTAGLAKVLRLPAAATTDINDDSLEGVYRDRSYDRQRLRLSRARHISEVANLLDHFCRHYGESLSLRHDGDFVNMPMRELEQTPFFQKALADVSQLREEGTRRNRADAANISVLDLAEHVGKNYILVTGTTMLSKLRPGKMIDPISLLLRLHLATPQRRKQRAALSHLEHLHAHVLKLVVRSTTVLEGVEGASPYITRSQAQDWVDHLKELEGDANIGSTIRLITATHIDAENRKSLIREDVATGENWPSVEHLTQVRRAVSHLGGIIVSVYPKGDDPLEDLGFHWSELNAVNSFIEKRLISADGRTVLEISASEKICICAWSTNSKLMDFLRLIHGRLDSGEIEGGKQASIRLYYRDRPTRVMPLDRLSILLLSGNIKTVRPDAFRVFSETMNLVYEIGEDIEALPKLTLIVDINNRELAGPLFQETFAEFIPSSILARELETLWEAARTNLCA